MLLAPPGLQGSICLFVDGLSLPTQLEPGGTTKSKDFYLFCSLMYPLAAGATLGTSEALDTEGEEEPRGLVESREQPSAKIWTLKELKKVFGVQSDKVCVRAGWGGGLRKPSCS